ncbi:hypothetical protein [Clostridium sp.]|uniref:hypothetical protein n=1 Tax=Clostridium sp. TaxID=1506 RepID=UPI003F666823
MSSSGEVEDVEHERKDTRPEPKIPGETHYTDDLLTKKPCQMKDSIWNSSIQSTDI